MLQVFMFI